MKTSFSISRPAASIAGVLALWTLLGHAAVLGATFELQGQCKGCSCWVSGNLHHWQDLDYVPCRVRITGKAFAQQRLEITAPGMNHGDPGFESLLHFTISPNVTLISGPTLSPGGDTRCYTMNVSYNGEGEGYIQFFARLAVGVHRNPGSSLMLSGDPSSMGRLQIHKPAPAGPMALALGQFIERSQMLADGGFQVELPTLPGRLYSIQYSSDLESWKAAECVISGNGSWVAWVDRGPPETESHPSTQTMRFYRAFLLPQTTQPSAKQGDQENSCPRHHGCSRSSG